MTPLPHTVGAEQSVTDSLKRMSQLGVRHLPVLHGGTLVGIVSERDLAFAGAIRSADPDKTPVEDVMTPEPYVVGPDMPLSVVADAMAKRRVGCAIVMEAREVTGILTTTDALGLLSQILAQSENASAPSDGSWDVAKRIRDEHNVLRNMLATAERLGERVLQGDVEAEPELFEHAHELYQTLIRHLEIEDTVLLPALRRAGATGIAQANRLQDEHLKQRIQLKRALSEIDIGHARHVAQMTLRICVDVQEDMDFEETHIVDILKNAGAD